MKLGPLESITIDEIRKLKENQVMEGYDIDYKVNLTGNRDSFIGHVCSFANESDGDILIGVEEKDKFPIAIPGIQKNALEGNISKIEDWIRTGTEPRLTSFKLREVEIGDNLFVIVLRVMRSPIAPHRVTRNWKFHGRMANGRTEMTMDQIRAAFTKHEIIADRMRDFQVDRVQSIAKYSSSSVLRHVMPGSDVPKIPLSQDPKFILHLIPYSAFSKNERVDIHLAHDKLLYVSALGTTIMHRRYNLDGVIGIERDSENERGYLQVFRSGIIEAVGTPNEDEERRIIAGVEHWVYQSLPDYLNLLNQLDIVTPIYLFLSLTGVKGKFINTAAGRYSLRYVSHPQSENNVLLPEMEINEYDQNMDLLLQNLFDILWQAFGHPKCPLFSDDGVWKDG